MATSVGISLDDIDQGQISAAVNGTLIEGNKVSAWWKSQERSLVTGVTRTIRAGINNGLTSQQIASNLRSNVFKGTQAQAQALVSTGITAVSNKARMDSFSENQDVLKGYQQVSTFDSRTSDICIAYAGMAWDFEGNPLDEKTTLPFNGGPPRHFNCRSTLVPVTKSFEELGLTTKKKIPEGTRASMDGQIPADTTFAAWLSPKPIAFQDKLLGRARAKLFRDKRITLNQLVDMRGNPLTVQELMEQAKTRRMATLPKPSELVFTGAKEWFKTYNDPSVETEDILMRGKAAQRKSVKVFERRIDNGTATASLHKVDGEWTAARKKVHNRILDDFFEGKGVWAENVSWKQALPGKGKKPTVTVLGGRGGSGKTFMTEGANAPVNLKKNLVINSDLFKEALPEWDGWNAALLHEEASYLLKRAQKIAEQRGVNIVLDITMQGGTKKMMKTLQPLIDQGYSVEAFYMHLPRQEAAFRALGRSTKADNPRYVPTEIILESVDNEEVFDFLVQNNIATRWGFYDNQVPFGQDPRLVAGNFKGGLTNPYGD